MSPSDARHPTNAVLEKLDGPLLRALAAIPVATWIADRVGLVVWMNVTATALLGERTGAHFTRFVASDGSADARETFARDVHGRLHPGTQRVKLRTMPGLVAAEVASVPIRDGTGVIGVIALVLAEKPTDDGVRREPEPRLTPRQNQVLRLLADGYSTTEMASALQISEQTVRNHVRFLLAELRVRNRLEAVVVALRNNWLGETDRD
jgi:DNA-binding CsgD family transcriptional regulator